MGQFMLDMDKYKALARQAGAEGCVLLKNDRSTLPLNSGCRLAVFGRAAFHYYKSGLGSGGLVNTRYVTGILDALKSDAGLLLNEELLSIYEEWLQENPYDEGNGWGQTPWSQKEMPVTQRMLEIAREAEACLIVIGRTAGEDQDTEAAPGGYLLTEAEEQMIRQITSVCPKTAVLLNVGNIIDMNWVERYDPGAVLYVWQGGQEGGNGVLDVLTGRVNPCGKLTDTIARYVEDYPAHGNFGDALKNYYCEDVYVGYRYFETFRPEAVLYPFGYGLSYTSFAFGQPEVMVDEEKVTIKVSVKNIGQYSGKEVVQAYVGVPQGKLGNPVRKLIGYGKTKLLARGETECISITAPKYVYASYDDSGITGHKSCYVMEKGRYAFYVGSSVRDTVLVKELEEEEQVLEQLQEAAAPAEAFMRIRPLYAGGEYRIEKEKVPLRTVCSKEGITKEQIIKEQISKKRPKEVAYTGDRGYKLADVLDKRISMDEFVAQISHKDLMALFYGEGMCSTKVTPGTAAAFGGITDSLQKLGIPAACCADGPSGIRMDCGTKAFSLPNGTMLGCTWNDDLAEELYAMLGQELRLNRIDSILGPGMNIHRHPLNGRNFEYISEEPLLTGRISAAQLCGLQRHGIAGTIKHFAANNQEYGRRTSDSVVSERALREIYLKGFEIAVKEGKARSVMTTYGALNGIWTAGSYDLCTTILRREWGFDGIVMTDWWAEANYEGQPSEKNVKAPMVSAQNDLFMCVPDASVYDQEDDLKEHFEKGLITRGELQRGAKNILTFILGSPAMLYQTGRISAEELAAAREKDGDDISAADITYYTADARSSVLIPGEQLHPSEAQSDVLGIVFDKMGIYSITITMKSHLSPLAQLPISVFYDNSLKAMISIQGTEGKWISETRDLGLVFGHTHFVKLYYGANGIVIDKVEIRLEKGMVPDW